MSRRPGMPSDEADAERPPSAAFTHKDRSELASTSLTSSGTSPSDAPCPLAGAGTSGDPLSSAGSERSLPSAVADELERIAKDIDEVIATFVFLGYRHDRLTDWAESLRKLVTS